MSQGLREPLEVLLVEDNPADAELIADMLDHVGTCRHERVGDLAQARRCLPGERFDVVVLDLHLPDGRGVECVKAIQSQAAQLPIVVLTGVDDEALALACVAAGAQDYLAKNELRPQALRRAIAYAVTRAQERAERVRADALQARLAAIVESSYDAILSYTTEGVITSWNPGAERIFGFTAIEAVGQPLSAVVRAQANVPDRADGSRLFEVQRGPQAGSVEEIIRCHKDGQPLNLSVVTSVIRDATGACVAVAAIMRNVTDIRRRDAELQRLLELQAVRERRMTALTERLRNLQEEERTRISREVHDGLGQLLTCLKMDTGWLLRKASAGRAGDELLPKLEEVDALLDKTVQAVQRIAVQLRPSALDALGLASALRDEARRFETRSGVETVIEIRPTESPESAVATALFRIFQELLTNVARHANAKRVRIAFTDDANDWFLDVRDDGVGLPDEPVDRVGGSLGMLGMTERAESLGGSCRIESLPGGGTLGHIKIPKKLP